MSTFHFTRPSRRAFLGLIFFLVTAYIAGKLEHFIVPGAIHLLWDRLHLSFSAIFGPKPAVPVNLLTTIVVIRSLYVLAITWIYLKIDQRPWSAVGYSNAGAIRSYAHSLIAAFLAISILMTMMWFSHAVVFDGLRLHSSNIVTYGVYWLFSLLLVGIAEERLDRGYALVSIAHTLGVLPAVLLTSFVFAAVCRKPREDFFWFATGVPLRCHLRAQCLSHRITRVGRRLPRYVGLDARVLFRDSRQRLMGCRHLFQFRPQGSEILSGGTVVPEGSIYAFAILGGLIAYELTWHYRNFDEALIPRLETKR